jgi:hypothetical protein
VQRMVLFLGSCRVSSECYVKLVMVVDHLAVGVGFSPITFTGTANSLVSLPDCYLLDTLRGCS